MYYVISLLASHSDSWEYKIAPYVSKLKHIKINLTESKKVNGQV